MEEFPDSSNDNKLENQKNIYKVDIDKLLGFRHVAKSNQEDLIEMMYFNYKVVFNNELELIYLEKQFSGEKPVWPKKTESKKDWGTSSYVKFHAMGGFNRQIGSSWKGVEHRFSIMEFPEIKDGVISRILASFFI